jgi:hypothetical protein
MANRKDIFDLFRDNEHKLSTPPSTRSWRRLERRLDSHRNRHRGLLGGTFGMVAAVALLCVFAFLITIGFGEQRNRLLALNNKSFSQLESLTFTDADFNLDAAVQQVVFAQQAQANRQRPISEGTALQKLVPNGQNKQKQSSHLSQFHWLEGKWQSLSPDGKTAILESWSVAGTGKMVGQAASQGKVIEKMRLEDVGNGLTFVSDFGTGKSVQYSLLALNQREAIFENRTAGFPEQVILRRESPSRLTVIYQNAALLNSDTERVQALQQRHDLASQQAVRKMSRLALQ